VVPTEHRTPVFGMLMAVNSVGMLMGSQLARFSTVTTSWAVATWSTNWIPLLAASLQALSLLWAFSVVSESLTPEQRMDQPSLRGSHPLMGLAILRRSSLFLRLTLCISVYFFTYQGLYQYSTFYEQRLLDFTKDDFATNELIHSVLNILICGGIIKALADTFQERWLLAFAVGANLLQYSLFALLPWCRSSWVVFGLVDPLFGVQALVVPAASGLKSKNSAPHEQGLVQGALYGMMSLAMAVGPLCFSALYDAVSDVTKPVYGPSIPFYFGIVLCGVAMLMALRLPRSGGMVGASPDQPIVMDPSVLSPRGSDPKPCPVVAPEPEDLEEKPMQRPLLGKEALPVVPNKVY